MADSVGQIGLDLVVNQNQFKQQMAGIQGLAKKAGAALAAAFAVKKIIDFGAKCIELGSDLSEVQNVVDVTFPRMSKQVDDFANNAITSFGLSETMAKKFTGTFGAMAKAFGFGEQAAYEMSTTLTGLAGDVASFYNTSQDEAYTKLKSVFTGETETLKDLGIVMTQSALDSYALANGYGKVTAKMSEAEKVALRYKFVQDQLSLASGDFIRTADGWANQVRVLKLQFDSLKATIGQGLINVLTPVIQVINRIISKLMSLANAFKAFTEMVTGKKGGGGASAATAGMEAMAQSADKAGAAAGGAGSAAKKAAKDMKSATTGIDELNIINPDTDSGGGGSGGGTDGGYSADEFDMGELDTSAVDEMDSKYAGLIEKANELKNLFMAGFKVGFGDTSVLDSMRESIQSIKDSLTDIFTSPEVEQAATRFTNILAINLGKIAGSMASIGASIADNLLGGISLFLQQNSERIRDYIVSMLNIGSRIAEISGNFSKALATAFSSLRSNSAKQITADIIGIFSEAFMGATELAGTFAADVLDTITAPFVENADYIRTTLEDTFSAVEPIFSTIKDLVAETFEKIGTTYDEHVAPMLATFKQGFTEIGTLLLDVYNTYFLPVLQNLSGRFVEFKDQYLSPLIDKFLEFGGKVADAVTKLWTGVIQPFIEWFITNVAPVIAACLQDAIDTFIGFWESVSGIIEGLLTALGGVIDFIVGVFTGDWSLAWEGIKEIFSGIWEALKELVSGAVTFIQNVVNMAWTAISGATSTIWNGIKALLNTLWNWLKSLANTLFNAIKTSISTAWENVKSKTSEIWESIKEFVSGLWDTIKTVVDEKFTAMKDAITGAWDTVKEKTKETWDGIWADIKGIINMIIDGVENMANRVIDAINAMIDAVNEVADKIPGIGADFIPNIPNIHLPRLAQGGFVRANTPQLAMIGDNRHYGEIVAPEDKMQEMVDRAVALASQTSSNGMSEQYLSIMANLLQRIIDLIEQMDLTVNIDIREIKKKLVELDKRNGYTLRTT
ncbi:phage tail protein [Enterocloster clostridioformis]|uniref:phage tail protein n=1 Tax=Enterocloster clostridioformis TaxID=1531 RepID=UPI00321B4AB4